MGIIWDWEYDRDFVALLEQQIQRQRLQSYSVSHHNALETLKKIQRGELSFGAYLDRSDNTSEPFAQLSRGLARTPAVPVNAPEAVARATDKATMHLEFLTAGIPVPFTIIISPFSKKREVELTLSDLSKLGRPFIIKPANTTGGGIGVILGAESLKDVIESRKHHKNDKYLLQECISPARLSGKKAWFRVFYVYGWILPCWWDDETHVYTPMTGRELRVHGLRPLVQWTRKIWEVCSLSFFSTEITRTHDGRFVVVDYVNDVCDMRLQSLHPDGVPDRTVERICRRIASSLSAGRKRL